MKRIAATLVLAGSLALTLAGCGGGGADGRNAELLQSLPQYPGSVEIDRHSEELDLSGAATPSPDARRPALLVQYATADDKRAVQSFLGERLVRVGFRPSTRRDPSRPKDELAFVDGQKTVLVAFSQNQFTWSVSAEAGGTPPPGARTFFVITAQDEPED